MARLVLAPRARSGLHEIWLWVVERGGPERAELIYDRIMERCLHLAARPMAGRAAPEFGKDVRCFTFHPYIVLYRLRGSHVEIARIVHGARDRTTLIPSDPSDD